jgi:biotin carboxylase
VLDIYDPVNISTIVSTARKLGCRSVLMQSDDRLLPIVAEANRQLGSPAIFSDAAVASTIDKKIMRDRFVGAGMELPYWSRMNAYDDISNLPMPCIVKPLIGQGSAGVSYVTDQKSAESAVAYIRDEMLQNDFLVEEYLPGRQFNVDGVIFEGRPFFHMINEEEFGDFRPLFKPCWYLFGITLEDQLRQTILKEAGSALAAADFWSGAFHVELKFKGQQAYAFDIANRMPADWPKYVRLVHEVSPVSDYLKVMSGEPVTQRQILVKRSHLRFYNYHERPAHKSIDKLAQVMADGGEIRLARDGILLEITADNEGTLRTFLDDVYALRDHN